MGVTCEATTRFGVTECACTISVMLARYKIYRGKRPVGVHPPDGIRQDTRKHTRHCLRPCAEIVSEYLANPSSAA